MKKFLAVTLTLAITLALFAFPLPANAAVTTESTTNVLFQDDFSDYKGDYTSGLPIKDLMIDNGWNSTSTNTQAIYAKTGSYVSPIGVQETQMVTSLTDTANWSNYAVSADISFTDVFVTTEEEARVDASAVVVLNATELANGGYEVGLHLGGDDTKKVIIRHRGVATLASKEYSFNADGTVYTVKAEYNAGVINCYINGTLELSYNTSNDDIMLTKGSAGFRKVASKGNSAEITFDNFKVEKTEKTVWFEENFTYGENDNVNSISGLTDADVAGIKQNGALAIDFETAHNYLVNTNGTEAWNDYSVEADFTMTRTAATTSTGWFGLSGRMKNGAGYEFTIMVSSTEKNTVSARIRQLSPNAEKAKTDACTVFESGSTYNIKLEFVGNTVNGYINDNLVCTYVDTSYHSTRGTVGINVAQKGSCSVDVSIDNLKVIQYTPITEYFNQTFDNGTTAQTLTNTGYVAVATNDDNLDTATMATYLNKGKLSLATDKTQLGLFAPYINSNAYTVQTEVVIDEAPSAAGYPCGLLIGASDRTYASGYYFEVRVNKSGAMDQIRVRKNGAPQNDINGIALDSNITKGDTALLKAVVTYDATNEQSTVVVSVISDGVVLVTKNFTVDGELKGYAAAWKNGPGGVSFDNFTAYNVNSYVSPEIGEMDGDGVVTAADGKYIRNYLLGTNDATSANINGDTASDIRDLVHFKKVFEFYK